MQCNKYKLLNNSNVILYSRKEKFEPDTKALEQLQFELVEENVDPRTKDNQYLPLLDFDELLLRKFGVRTNDKLLDETHLITFKDLSDAYFLIRMKNLNKPKRIRDLVEDKYSFIINNLPEKDEELENK